MIERDFKNCFTKRTLIRIISALEKNKYLITLRKGNRKYYRINYNKINNKYNKYFNISGEPEKKPDEPVKTLMLRHNDKKIQKNNCQNGKGGLPNWQFADCQNGNSIEDINKDNNIYIKYKNFIKDTSNTSISYNKSFSNTSNSYNNISSNNIYNHNKISNNKKEYSYNKRINDKADKDNLNTNKKQYTFSSKKINKNNKNQKNSSKFETEISKLDDLRYHSDVSEKIWSNYTENDFIKARGYQKRQIGFINSHEQEKEFIKDVVKDVMNSNNKSFRINGKRVEIDEIINQLKKIKDEHIEYCANKILNNKKIKHKKNYIITSLYNSIKSKDNKNSESSLGYDWLKE
ncbi:hypothetical protein [Gemella sp. oral taxon 928]|uniref:hypothetical protein n=1 Tax=Gemella sp. oral taxon 928 TaxID=1785995 RepID=UPI0018D22A66|nr:hypothetical protein [Gemella sp. oral taxon 928]